MTQRAARKKLPRDVREADDMDARQIVLSKRVWRMVDECLWSGLFGENIDEVVLSLMRAGLIEAIGCKACAIRDDADRTP